MTWIRTDWAVRLDEPGHAVTIEVRDTEDSAREWARFYEAGGVSAEVVSREVTYGDWIAR